MCIGRMTFLSLQDGPSWPLPSYDGTLWRFPGRMVKESLAR
jgi:hypothetical protein